MARLAQQKIAEGSTETAFYNAKVTTARFYFSKILPRTKSHVAVMASGNAPLAALAADDFII